MKLFTLLVLCALVSRSRQEEDDCKEFDRLTYTKPGNITITGIFDAFTGENCSEVVDFGVELTSAAVWLVTALERSNYLPGIKIGLSVFDACTTSKMAHEAFAEAIIRESCLNVSNIGTITTPEIDEKISALKQKLNRTTTKLDHVLDVDALLKIVAELLTNLHWTTVNRVIADTNQVLNNFSLKMSDEGICVYDEVLSADKYAVNNIVLKPFQLPHDDIISKDSPVIVLLTDSQRISNVFAEMTPEMRKMSAKWLLVPTDFILNLSNEYDLPDEMYSVLPLIDKKDRLLQFLTDEELQKDHMNHREATRSPLFLQAAVGILELLKPFKIIHDIHCQHSIGSCPELMKLIADIRDGSANVSAPKSSEITPERIINALNALKLDLNENEPFLYIASSVNKEGGAEDAAIFQIFDVKTSKIKPVPLIVNERLFNERRSRTKRARVFKLSVDDIEKIRKREEVRQAEKEMPYTNNFPPLDKHPCVDILADEENNMTKSCGICQNLIRFYLRSTRPPTDGEVDVEEVTAASWTWRLRTWVAINASVASIGTICTVTVIIFIVIRLCKGDILEGSPHFSFLILLSIILLYVTTLPFSLEDTSESVFFCKLKILSPSLCYAFLFSIMLSRSAMIICSERDGGIMNHINGCLQSVLCFFICIVQIALTIQFCVYNAIGGFDCSNIHGNNKFLILLAYDFFLLFLLAFAAPFTMRSKRNYREGTFFSISTLLVICVWSAWVTVYKLFPADERDAAVVLGQTATATAVLLSVFIPRTYLMATATVRDKITNSLPSLAYMNSSNISEINYRSNQALCDSVTVRYGSPKLGLSNSRIYSIQLPHSAPSSPTNFPMDGPDYVINRRKTFIEICRAESPYDTHESPDNITRF